jgi:hypothetical protein
MSNDKTSNMSVNIVSKALKASDLTRGLFYNLWQFNFLKPELCPHRTIHVLSKRETIPHYVETTCFRMIIF